MVMSNSSQHPSTQRFLSVRTILLRKWRYVSWLAYAAVSVTLIALLLTTPIIVWGTLIQGLLAVLFTASALMVEAELESDVEGLRVVYYFAPRRKALFTRTIRWADQPSVSFRRISLTNRSMRFNVIASLTPTFDATVRRLFPIRLVLNEWIEVSDVQLYQSKRAASSFWKTGFGQLMYSDAPEVFKLGDVFRSRGYDPGNGKYILQMGNINLRKTAIRSSIALGVISAATAFIVAFNSEWLYVEPHLGWYVGGFAFLVATAVIVVWGQRTHCDTTSIVGAAVAGAFGIAFLAAIGAPDLAALLEPDSPAIEFRRQSTGTWTTSDEQSPVRELPEPPLGAIDQPSSVRVACGLPYICAFKRTDFKS